MLPSLPARDCTGAGSGSRTRPPAWHAACPPRATSLAVLSKACADTPSPKPRHRDVRSRITIGASLCASGSDSDVPPERARSQEAVRFHKHRLRPTWQPPPFPRTCHTGLTASQPAAFDSRSRVTARQHDSTPRDMCGIVPLSGRAARRMLRAAVVPHAAHWGIRDRAIQKHRKARGDEAPPLPRFLWSSSVRQRAPTHPFHAGRRPGPQAASPRMQHACHHFASKHGITVTARMPGYLDQRWHGLVPCSQRQCGAVTGLALRPPPSRSATCHA